MTLKNLALKAAFGMLLMFRARNYEGVNERWHKKIARSAFFGYASDDDERTTTGFPLSIVWGGTEA